MSASSKHPIDFDAYARGDLIPMSVVIDAARAERVDTDDRDSVRLFALRLKARVQQHLFRQGRGYVSVRVERDGIRILRDGVEQFGYCRSESHKLLRQFRRRYQEACSVDPALLPSTERKQWQELLARGSRVLGSAGYPRRSIPQLPQIAEESTK